jgi:hypothetical protein
MTTLLNGVLGGAIVGGFAAAVTAIVAKRAGTGDGSKGTPERSRAGAIGWKRGILLVGYGSALGGGLLALELFVLGVLGVPPTLGEAFAVALAWSGVVFGAVFVGWRVGGSRLLTQGDRQQLLVYHLCYGLGLGAWIRLTWIT